MLPFFSDRSPAVQPQPHPADRNSAGKSSRAGTHAARRVNHFWAWLLLGSTLGFSIPSVVQGQSEDSPPESAESLNSVDSSDLSNDDDALPTRNSTATKTPASVGAATEDGPGVLGNIGFLGMQTFGREESIAPAEIFPYLLLDEDFLFSNIRGFVSTEGHFGGNFGVGYRRLVPNQNAWYGVNAFYDVDDTSSQMFHQLGFGVEAAFQSVELRSNAYFPVGATDRTLSTSAANARFVGSQLVFDQQIMRGYALRGVDLEVGYNLPLPALGENSLLRWFVGGYFFGGNSAAEGITGVQTRAEAQIANAVTTHLQFSKDDEYGSNLMVGMTIDFPFGEAHPGSKWRRNTPSPFRFVHRNYNVILDRKDESQAGVAAINPLTGDYYQVAHVNTSAGGSGNGNAENPWSSLQDAQNSGADLIFVHAGSVIDEAITLGDNVALIGDTGNQWIQVSGRDSTLLPTFNSADSPVAGPRFSNITGDAVTLGNSSTISGFRFENIDGRGIYGNGISGATIRDVTFNNSIGSAIALENVSGTVNVQNALVDGITGSGLSVTGGDMTLNLLSSRFRNITGDAIRLYDIDAGTLNLVQTDVENTTGHALELNEVNTTVNVSNFQARDTDDVAISIQGGDDGVYQFTDGVKLDAVNGGVRATNTAADITFGLLEIATRDSAAGVYLENAEGTLQFAALNVESATGPGVIVRDVEDLTISRGILKTVGEAAFDAENAVMNVSFDSVSVDGGDFGIRLDDVTGTFVVVGTNEFGGVIKNTDVGVLLNNADVVTLRNMDFTDNGTAIQSQGSELLAMSGLIVSGSTGYALDSLNDKLLSVQASDFDENGAIGGGTIRVRADADGSYRSEFIGLRISDLNGTPIAVSNSGAAIGKTLDVTFSNNIIEATRNDQAGVRVSWSGSTTVNALSNTVVTAGTNSHGFLVEANATTDRLMATFASNVIQVGGTNSTGINVISTQQSDIQVQTNSIVTSGSGGTGMRFDLSKVSDVWLIANTITDVGSAGTGMHFVQVADASRLQFDANLIDMKSTSATVDRGIRFTTIADDATIQLFGNYNNTVTGATEALFIPAGRSTGGFILNGAVVPQ